MGLADILFKGKAKAAVDEDLNEIFKTSVCGFFVARVRLWP